MLRKSTNQLSIKPKISRSAQLTIIIVVGVVVVLGLYLSYSYGVRSGNEQYGQDSTMISQLNNNIQTLRDDLAKAEEKVVFAQRQQQIQEEAYKQMSKAYSASEQKNQYLGSRLDFYRSIISPENGQAGPVIQGLDYRIEQDAIEFDVTLVQAIKHNKQIRGSVILQLFDGDNVLATWPKSGSKGVSYQYYQQISGSMNVAQLPPSARMKIKLTLQNDDFIERWFDVTQMSDN